MYGRRWYGPPQATAGSQRKSEINEGPHHAIALRQGHSVFSIAGLIHALKARQAKGTI